jgi:hypothetical protein
MCIAWMMDAQSLIDIRLLMCAVVSNAEVDIATLTVKAADDPRTLNKQLVIRHKPNLVTFNSIVELWEKKIGHKLQKTFVPAAEVQKQIDGKYQDLIRAMPH